MPSGVRCQSSHSSCLDYGLLLIYLTRKFSYLLSAIGLALGFEGTLIKKKHNKRITDIDVVNEYRNLFLPLLSVYASVFNEAGVPHWKLHMCQIKVSAARVVEKIKFRLTALICRILKCERISEVKSTFYYPLVSIYRSL